VSQAGTAPDGDASWRPTTAFLVAATVGLVLLVVAGVTRRPALAVVAVPLLTEVAWSLRRVSRPGLRVAVAASVGRVREGDDLEVLVRVTAPADADAVVTALETEPLLAAPDALRPVAALPLHASKAVPARAAHWGRDPAAHLSAAASAAHGLLRSDTVNTVGATIVVEPGVIDVSPVRPSTRTGVVGPRPSRRSGAGSDLTGVREFLPGDRLRHVHWRVTARRGDLHVTTTSADREASLLLALDTGSEFGARDATTLDTAVRAAAVLARHHLREGDRVGFVDLSDPTRVLKPGTGHRQLDRVVDRLVGVRRSAPSDLHRLPAIVARAAPGAHVVVLSPLLRPTVGAGVARLAQHGIAVTVVDTSDRGVDRSSLPVATRLWLLERDGTADELVGVGVAVRPWR
jgi:uncharacterized protein (DUF58 family)